MDSYNYEVDLKYIFSRNLTVNGVYEDIPGIENASFYKRPNQMAIVGTNDDKKNSLIEQRKFDITQILNKGHGSRLYNADANLIPTSQGEWDRRRRDMYSTHLSFQPNILCNLNCMTSLMRPYNNHPKAIKATLFRLDNGNYAIDLKFGFNYTMTTNTNSTSYHMESVLSTDPSKKEDSTKTLISLYEASLMKNTNEVIHIALTAETDGLWENNQRPDDYKYTTNDVVEIKGVQISTLIKDFFFEEQWLRTTWSNCRIRDLSTVLCGIMHGNTLKEVWLCNVNEIKKRVDGCAKRPVNQWRKAFPKSLKLNGSGNPPDVTQLQAWTADDCFGLLYNDFSLILKYFEAKDSEAVQYYLQDSLTVKNNGKFGLEKVDEEDYLQLKTIRKKRLLNFTDLNQNKKIKLMEVDCLKKVVDKLWTYLGTTDKYHKIKDKTKNVQLKLGIERSDHVSIQVEFKDEDCAAHFQREWNKYSEECKKKGFTLPYKMFVNEAVTDRQQRYLKTQDKYQFVDYSQL